MKCRKKRYQSRKAAKDYIKKWNKRNPDKKLTYSYHCSVCDCYHTTKVEKSARHIVTDVMRKRKGK